ncbi:MAG: hypothetical protein OSJ62_07585 [Lachnospiraceae bacterium]|nr:hypothetical protein [Lachnospiraceae bacterium]
MTFQEIVKEDIEDVFFSDFAETHNVDGKDKTVLIGSLENRDRETHRVTEHVRGVYMKEIGFYIKPSDLEALPIIGRKMKFDGQTYLVQDAVDENGLYFIRLGGARH